MYDSLSSDYDRFVNWPSRLGFEMPLIEAQLKQVGARRVLDAACGTGKHAIALAEAGYSAAGADLSAAMIEQAQRNAAGAGLSMAFAAAGFGGLAKAFNGSPLFPFDALLCLGNSLPHVLSAPELAAALVDFAACLRPGGLLLLQNRNFDAVMHDRQRWMEPQSQREGGAEWVFLRFYDFEPEGLINFHIITLQREGTGGWSQKIASTHLRPLLEAELTAALKTAGFTEVACYGGMDGAPFDARSSPNLIAAARMPV